MCALHQQPFTNHIHGHLAIRHLVKNFMFNVKMSDRHIKFSLEMSSAEGEQGRPLGQWTPHQITNMNQTPCITFDLFVMERPTLTV